MTSLDFSTPDPGTTDDAVERVGEDAAPRAPLGRPASQLWQWRPGIVARRGNRVEGPGLGAVRVRLATAFWGASAENVVRVGPGFRSGGLSIRIAGQDNRVEFGANVRFTGRIEVRGFGLTVRIGDRCDFKRTDILAFYADVSVGRDCLVATEARLRSGDFHTITDRASGAAVNAPRPVVVGDGVWLAARATLLKGARVPDGCVVGWGSIVTRAFDEPDCVLAGSPARIVRRGISWAR